MAIPVERSFSLPRNAAQIVLFPYATTFSIITPKEIPWTDVKNTNTFVETIQNVDIVFEKIIIFRISK